MLATAWLVAAVAYLTGAVPAPADETAQQPADVAAKIDELLQRHWDAHDVKPAEPADDATFLRRAMLDLAGRIPTTAELDSFLAEKAADKRAQLVRRLIDGPEFPLHFGNVLDQMIQGRYAGSEDFVDYLRISLRDRKAWDTMFREMMLGPWDTDELEPANRFLDKRAKTTDVLAADATRVFFGVDISCAKCHDHPLVDDWKQDNFYGMLSFFNRTTGGKGKVGEKNDGEVTFVSGGAEKTAKMMFLSGRVIDEPKPEDAKDKKTHFSRREQLVDVALEEKRFFSRSIVNRMWEYFFGRGLVTPVDQMHSANEAAVPELLDWLADDFADTGYDLRRLIAAITSSRAYALSSVWPHDAPMPDDSLFAVAWLRPLTRRQLAMSLLLATGDGNFGKPDPATSRAERLAGAHGVSTIEQYLALEARSAELLGAIDPRSAEFQSSATEALFMSNNATAQKLVAAEGENLVARLAEMKDDKQAVEAAFRAVLTRAPSDEEVRQITESCKTESSDAEQDRQMMCEQIVWALLTSAEFRFNH